MDNIHKMIENMIETERKNNEAEDDVFENGVRCCGKCHTPKEKMIEHNGKYYLCAIECECAKESRIKKEEEEAKQKRLNAVMRRRKEGFPDKDMMNWTFEKDDGLNPKLTDALKKYVEEFEKMKEIGYGLILFGPVGTGKTYAAAEVANALIEKGYPCLVTNFTRISQTLWGEDKKQEYMDSLNDFDLIVLDDLATEYDSEYMKSIIFQIIDSRYRANLPMIVTTNVNPFHVDKQSLFDARLYDRLQERCLPIRVEGSNKRVRLGTSNAKIARDLLGI